MQLQKLLAKVHIPHSFADFTFPWWTCTQEEHLLAYKLIKYFRENVDFPILSPNLFSIFPFPHWS